MRRFRCLDLFCKAGGASWGYYLAGFDVTGVDIDPQPNYPDGLEFIQADAFEFVREHGHKFDLITASPMCRDHTVLAGKHGKTGTGWQLAAIRDELARLDRPWVIENVPGAPLRPDVRLCGDVHFGLRVVRHRYFESGFPLVSPPWCRAKHRAPVATREQFRMWHQGWHASVTGNIGSYVGPEAMGIDWMTGNELSQAIPPVYTEYIGHQFLDPRYWR